MTGTWTWTALATLALSLGALGAPLAEAKPRAPAHRSTAQSDQAQPRSPARREKLKRHVRTLRAYALTDQLSLDESTGNRLWPVLARWDDEIDRLVQERRELVRQLDAASTNRDVRAVERLLDAVAANHRAFGHAEDQRIIELRKILPPVQVARLLVAVQKFERKLQRKLQRAFVRGRSDTDAADAAAPDGDDDATADAPPAPRR